MRGLFFFLFFCSNLIADIPSVLVSVAPYKFFVERIAGNTVNVQLIVPQGASSHTFEPSTRQMMAASCAVIWFYIGETFEDKVKEAFKSFASQMELIDLRQNVPLIQGGKDKCCLGSVDLHFWLSPRVAKIQAKTIADSLSLKFPSQAALFQKNLLEFQRELDVLDEQISILLKGLKNRSLFVSHPAYAYFCRDYELCQRSLEVEGKDLSPRQMTQFLSDMKTLNVSTIFVQKQYNTKAAKLVSNTLGTKIVVLDPYSENYLSAMWEIANAFATQ